MTRRTGGLQIQARVESQALEPLADRHGSFTEALSMEKKRKGLEPAMILRAASDLDRLPGIYAEIPSELEVAAAVRGRLVTTSVSEAGMGRMVVESCLFTEPTDRAIDREYVIRLPSGGPYWREIVLMIPNENAAEPFEASGVVEIGRRHEDGQEEIVGQHWLTKHELTTALDMIAGRQRHFSFKAGPVDNS